MTPAAIVPPASLVPMSSLPAPAHPDLRAAAISVEEHRATILDAVRPLPAISVALAEAAGRTLARDARAAVDAPPFDSSAMDGFAVRSADVDAATSTSPARLHVVADLPAGATADPALGPGEAARIMTGAPVPTAADAIVPFEDTAGGLADSLSEISVLAPPRAVGAHIRRRGEEGRLGDVIVPAGTCLGPMQLAALASAGVDRIAVAARPRIVVVSTGNELVPAGSPLRRGQIAESNAAMIGGLATQAGAVVVRAVHVDDDGAALTALLHDISTNTDHIDAVVFTGGVSAGAYEVVRTTVRPMSFGPVAMQPGRPQGFGVATLADGRSTLLFGLPGSPAGAAVSFEVFVRPALLALQGRAPYDRAVLRMRAAEGWRAARGRRQYRAVTVDRTDPAKWSAAPVAPGAVRLGAVDGYAIVPPGVDVVAPDDLVDVVLIG